MLCLESLLLHFTKGHCEATSRQAVILMQFSRSARFVLHSHMRAVPHILAVLHCRPACPGLQTLSWTL